jgi:hypothetical protein
MHVTDAPFAGAADLLRDDVEVASGYRILLDVLGRMSMPHQGRVKASPFFIYDQTELQARLRDELCRAGWSYRRALTPDLTYDGVHVTGTVSDLIGHGCHVILEFGNRASWAHNLVTRVVAAHRREFARLTVFVTPTDRLARQIDTNLASFERVAASVGQLAQLAPEMIPGPLVVVGVDAEPPSFR